MHAENRLPTKEELCRYLPLYKAALRGDWESAKRIFDQDEGAITAMINKGLDTALSVAVGVGEQAIVFVDNLVKKMPVDALELPNVMTDTALHIAAMVGNTNAAKILVKKHPASLYITASERDDYLPIHFAAKNAHKDTLEYLLSVTRDDHESMPFGSQSGLALLLEVIYAGFLDVAVNLVRRYPELARVRSGICALELIATKESAFASGSRLNSWQCLIYKYVPVKFKNDYAKDHKRRQGDIEQPSNSNEVINTEQPINSNEVIDTEQPINSNEVIDIEEPINSNEVIDTEQPINSNEVIDTEQPINSNEVTAKKYRWARFHAGSQKCQAMLWKVSELLVPHIKRIQEQKLMHLQAVQLVKCLCQEIESLNDLDASSFLVCNALLSAASSGIQEVVEEIVDTFPHHFWLADAQNRSIFQCAVTYRCENVYNLTYQMGKHKEYVRQLLDCHGNTLLHLAGKLAPPNKLNLIPGAALQMQRELQWYKEVEKFVLPSFIEAKNDSHKTPEMVFTDSHKELVVQGEKWMKDTANSCTIAATLIGTIAFAAAVTVPGGNNGSSGLPIFAREKTFICFVVSDAISLFTSTTSLLMFLSILTSRYEEGDFLYVLPKRLIIGLVMLFLSVTSMIVAFSSTLYIMFGLSEPWVLIPVALLACLPISSFVFLQFPLLVDLIWSTYSPGIFGKQSSRPFH